MDCRRTQMKLKKAIKLLSGTKYNWIAVDANLDIHMYELKPFTENWLEKWFTHPEVPTEISGYAYVGEYSGSKLWRDTLRKVT